MQACLALCDTFLAFADLGDSGAHLDMGPWRHRIFGCRPSGRQTATPIRWRPRSMQQPYTRARADRDISDDRLLEVVTIIHPPPLPAAHSPIIITASVSGSAAKYQERP